MASTRSRCRAWGLTPEWCWAQVHVDVWMDELKVVLGQASGAVNASESRSPNFDEPTLMQSSTGRLASKALILGQA